MDRLLADLRRLATEAIPMPRWVNIERRERCSGTYAVQYESRKQLCAVLRYAHTRHIPVMPAGAGLSGGRVGHPGPGLVLRGLSRAVEGHGKRQYRVHAGTTWNDAIDALDGWGRLPKVVHPALAATVVGSISLGGFGPHSLTRGAQADHVSEVGLALADGTELIATRMRNVELFRAALCGFGAVAVIEHAVLDSVPGTAPRHSWQAEVLGLDHALQTLQALPTQRRLPDAMSVRIGPHRTLFRLESSGAAARTIIQSLSAAAVQRVPHIPHFPDPRDRPRGRRIWRHFVVPLGEVMTLSRRLKALQRRAAAHALECRVLLFPHRGGAPRGPLPFLSPVRAGVRGDEWEVGVGLHLLAPTTAVEAAYALQATFHAVCIDAGGRPYAQAVLDCTESELRTSFGPALQRWRDIKQQVDPGSLMNRCATAILTGDRRH